MLLSELRWAKEDRNGVRDCIGPDKRHYHLRDWGRGIHMCVYRYDHNEFKLYVAYKGQPYTKLSLPEVWHPAIVVDALTLACWIADAVWFDYRENPQWADWICNPEETNDGAETQPACAV